MVEHDRIDVSERIDINKTNASKNVIFVIVGTLKILVLNMNRIFAMIAISMMLLLFLLKQVIKEFIFGV